MRILRNTNQMFLCNVRLPLTNGRSLFARNGLNNPSLPIGKIVGCAKIRHTAAQRNRTPTVPAISRNSGFG